MINDNNNGKNDKNGNICSNCTISKNMHNDETGYCFISIIGVLLPIVIV